MADKLYEPPVWIAKIPGIVVRVNVRREGGWSIKRMPALLRKPVNVIDDRAGLRFEGKMNIGGRVALNQKEIEAYAVAKAFGATIDLQCVAKRRQNIGEEAQRSIEVGSRNFKMV